MQMDLRPLFYALLLGLVRVNSETVKITWVIQEWVKVSSYACIDMIVQNCFYWCFLCQQVVDYLRPTVDLPGKAKRVSPYKIPDEQRSMKYLINGTHPGNISRVLAFMLQRLSAGSPPGYFVCRFQWCVYTSVRYSIVYKLKLSCDPS